MARIFVKVKARAKRTEVRRIDAEHWAVSVNAPPVDNKANAAVIAALAEHFKLPKARIALVAGKTSPQKIFEIG